MRTISTNITVHMIYVAICTLLTHFNLSRGLPLRIFLACVGGGAVQGSIRWWSSKHRAHHRWTDTEKDPYSVRKGVWYSHFMWMLLKQNPKNRGRTDISDLNDDPVVVWQHKHYGEFILVFGMLFPMFIAGFGWGDWKGGLIYAGILRFLFVQQATFCVNSLAHWLGEQVCLLLLASVLSARRFSNLLLAFRRQKLASRSRHHGSRHSRRRLP